MVQILSDTLPLVDTICKHAVTFVRNCLSSGSDGVYVSHMGSVLGQNVFFSSEHFAMQVDDLILFAQKNYVLLSWYLLVRVHYA